MSRGTRRRAAPAALTLAAAILASLVHAQSRATDFSGQWVLTALRPVPDDPDTLQIAAVDEFFVTQTQRFIRIEHTSKSGSHPAAGTFDFGVRNSTEDLPDGPHDLTLGLGFFGTQLIMSETLTQPPDASGFRASTGHGSIWLMDPDGRLVIEFREHRSRERPKIATRIYVRK